VKTSLIRLPEKPIAIGQIKDIKDKSLKKLTTNERKTKYS